MCEICEQQPRSIEVDHVVPWSAGGTDATINLRTLCRPHNQERSNLIDPIGEARHRIPATWWCIECALPTDHGFHLRPGDPEDPPHRCGGICPTDWWQLTEVDSSCSPVLAFCAHCDATSYTLWPL